LVTKRSGHAELIGLPISQKLQPLYNSGQQRDAIQLSDAGNDLSVGISILYDKNS
jgi:hypothetical protein